jgi:ubiquinone/menaquinone biosynthesis C-methylase UbiE
MQSNHVNKILNELKLGKDGIYGSNFSNTGQEEEIELREAVANVEYDDYLDEISHHHSIPVMDKEINRVLSNLPQDAIILDIGGCWGWHWRNISQIRSDVTVIIVDFVRSNLIHANTLLGSLINDQIYLVYGNATSLPFKDDNFNLVWTVQTFQHIPDFESAVLESHRVLRGGGVYKLFTQ